MKKMTLRTAKFTLALRGIGRWFGLNKLIAKLIYPAEYEKAFDRRMFEIIRAGDCIWDVGANVGFYTKKFSSAAGGDGSVVAFEPFPKSFGVLEGACRELDNAKLVQVALGASEEFISMEVGGDDLGATNRITADGSSPGASDIPQIRGDQFVIEHPQLFPSVLKIDTEGYELNVLKGCSQIIADPRLRVVFLEVHFGLLSQMGSRDGPAEIETLLYSSGFEIEWVDFSRLVAVRRG